MGAPIARYLRTATVAERGIDTSPEGQAAVRAWNTASRDAHWRGQKVPPCLNPTYRAWAWVLNLATLAVRARLWAAGTVPQGVTPTIRVWPAPAHWDAPGYWEGSPQSPFNVANPQPWEIPWYPGFSTGTAPPGMAADLGCLIDLDDDGERGWEILGLRKPEGGDVVVLNVRTRPAHWLGALAVLLGLTKPNYRAGDMVADAVHYRTAGNAGRVEGRGGGKVPKRRGTVTDAELAAGVIEHAISVTAMNFNHGPIPAGQPPCEHVDPATRVEHGDRHNGTRTPAGAASTMPGRVIRNGQAYAYLLTDDAIERWLDYRRYTGQLRVTARIFAVALRDYGWECVETGGGDPQSECGLTAEQWAAHGVPDEATCVRLLDGLERFGEVVALRPSRANLPAAA